MSSWLSRARFLVPTPGDLADFYCEVLGMTIRRDPVAAGTWLCGYPPAEGDDHTLWLEFSACAEGLLLPRPQADDAYWKIALATTNVDLAAERLRRNGVETSEPRQFEDVGYLCHLRDPAGLTIELIQHDFGSRQPTAQELAHTRPLGAEAAVSLVTLRTEDIESARSFWCDRLGFEPVSIQPVSKFGFTLYFFSPRSQSPPNPDLEAVENRPWLYRRPYGVLEFQERPGKSTTPLDPRVGFQGLTVTRAGPSKERQERKDPQGCSVILD